MIAPEKRQEFLDNYKANNFNIGKTCEFIGVSRSSYYEWLKEPEFKTVIENYKEYFIDAAEDTLYKAAEAGSIDAAKFVLKHLGKKRGYIDSLDVTSNGQTINTIRLIEIKKEDGDNA